MTVRKFSISVLAPYCQVLWLYKISLPSFSRTKSYQWSKFSIFLFLTTLSVLGDPDWVEFLYTIISQMPGKQLKGFCPLGGGGGGRWKLFTPVDSYTLYIVCSIHRGIPWVHRENIMSTSGSVQYIRGISWIHRGMSWVYPGMFSTSGDTMVHVGISWVHQGMFNTSGFSI